MTMDLIWTEQSHRFTHSVWGHLIELALANGWRPAGTLEPLPREIDDEDERANEGRDESWQQSQGPPVTEETDDGASRGESLQRPPARRSPEAEAIRQALLVLVEPPVNPTLGAYCENAGRRVTDGDALALADALESALPDLP